MSRSLSLAAVLILFAMGSARAATADRSSPPFRDAWAFAPAPGAQGPPAENLQRFSTAITPATWHELRSRALLNMIHCVTRAPGSNFLCAVGDGQYGPVVGAVGPGPVICRSWDGGATWTVTQPPVSTHPVPGADVNLMSVSFPTPMQGWAVGSVGPNLSSVIYHTTDGGDTWELQYETPTTPPNNSFLDVCFVDSLRGWAVGAIDPSNNVAITATTDGGRTWHTQPTGVNAAVSQIDFLNANVGYALANLRTTLKTTNGGATWTVAGTSSSYYQSWELKVKDAATLVVADGDAIQRSIDGGATWTPVLQSGFHEYGLAFSDASNGFAVGDYGATASSHDGGASYQPQARGYQQPLMSCVALDPSTACAVGVGGMITRTTDAGHSWSQVDAPGYISGGFLSDVDFFDESRGWIVDQFGGVYRTVDAGTNWSRVPVGPGIGVIDVKFTSPTRGWVCGPGGAWLTSNGGDSWERRLTTQGNPQDVWALADRCAWLCGANGYVARTSDGGETWEEPVSGTTQGLYGICFANERQGWIVGWAGTILHTSDGGHTWEHQNSGSGAPLYMVSFPDSLHGWACGINGAGGLVLHTDDGGATWTPQFSPGVALSGISFPDALDGAVCGGHVGLSYIATTFDGGTTWTESWIPTPQEKAMSIVLPTPFVGYSVGFDGHILKSTDLQSATTGVPRPGAPRNMGLAILDMNPNPSQGGIRLSYRLPSAAAASVTLLDAAGRVVLTRTIPNPGAGSGVFPLTGLRGLPAGVYLVRLRQGDSAVARKAILR